MVMMVMKGTDSSGNRCQFKMLHWVQGSRIFVDIHARFHISPCRPCTCCWKPVQSTVPWEQHSPRRGIRRHCPDDWERDTLSMLCMLCISVKKYRLRVGLLTKLNVYNALVHSAIPIKAISLHHSKHICTQCPKPMILVTVSCCGSVH